MSIFSKSGRSLLALELYDCVDLGICVMSWAGDPSPVAFVSSLAVLRCLSAPASAVSGVYCACGLAVANGCDLASSKTRVELSPGPWASVGLGRVCMVFLFVSIGFQLEVLSFELCTHGMNPCYLNLGCKNHLYERRTRCMCCHMM